VKKPNKKDPINPFPVLGVFEKLENFLLNMKNIPTTIKIKAAPIRK
jgi:hypothetical protein